MTEGPDGPPSTEQVQGLGTCSCPSTGKQNKHPKSDKRPPNTIAHNLQVKVAVWSSPSSSNASPPKYRAASPCPTPRIALTHSRAKASTVPKGALSLGGGASWPSAGAMLGVRGRKPEGI
eukprot:1143628-Pelagomonas_calceolata.AAC.3